MRLHPLQVASVERVTDNSVAVTLDVPAQLREEFAFAHGQHIVVERQGLRRTYSICVPAGSDELRIAIKRLPGGAFSSWATAELRSGDELLVAAPRGTFTTPVDPNRSRRYAAVAAGSGITPVLSIVATLLEREPLSDVALVYGNSTTSSIMFLDEIEDLKDSYPDRFQLFHVLSREAQTSELLSGRIDRPRLARFLDELLPVAEIDEWFLCGPLAMTETARRLLLERGVPSRRVHRELFHVDGEPRRGTTSGDAQSAPSVSAKATVTLDGRVSTFAVGEGETVLDALLRVRSDAPYACKGGVCGTCRARLLEGEVRMDASYALEDDERDARYVLACQAHSLTTQLNLDFDQ